MSLVNPELLWSFGQLPSRYVVLDTETTGLIDGNNFPHLVSIGVAFVDGGKLIGDRQLFVRPFQAITARSKKIHGIGDREAKQFPRLRDIWPDLCSALDGRLVVIHNASFDWRILNEVGKTSALSLPDVRGVFCTQKGATPWAVANGIPCSKRGPSLDSLTSVFGLENLRERTGFHSADNDAIQLFHIVRRLQLIFLSCSQSTKCTE